MAVNPDKPWRLEDMKFQDEGGKRRGVMGGAQGRSWIGKRNARANPARTPALYERPQAPPNSRPSDESYDQLPMVLPKVIDDAVAGARGPTLFEVHARIMYFVLPIPPEVDGLSEASLVVHHA